jgi:putative sigma-54 modulation protein
MTFKCSFKQMRTSAAIRDYAKEKSEKLSKYFSGRINVAWNFSMERELRHAHCLITGNHIDFFAEEQTGDVYASIDAVMEKIEKQIRKHKEVVTDHLHRQGRHLKAS